MQSSACLYMCCVLWVLSNSASHIAMCACQYRCVSSLQDTHWERAASILLDWVTSIEAEA